MTMKEYLSQAYRLDRRINSKLEQLEALNSLAARCTYTITGMPKNPNRSVSIMADTVDKIVDLQAEINRDIDRLVDLKIEIAALIKSVSNLEHQTLLELRYLCSKTWEQIAEDMGYNVRHVLRLHGDALESVIIAEACH